MGDENDEYHQAVLAQANYLGMDPEGDADFLWLAEEALKAELPEGWEMVMGEGEHEGVPFYYNEELNESTWEHPLDGYYREKFQRLKAERGSQPSTRRSSGLNRRGGEEEAYEQEQLMEDDNKGGRRRRAYDDEDYDDDPRRSTRRNSRGSRGDEEEYDERDRYSQQRYDQQGGEGGGEDDADADFYDGQDIGGDYDDVGRFRGTTAAAVATIRGGKGGRSDDREMMTTAARSRGYRWRDEDDYDDVIREDDAQHPPSTQLSSTAQTTSSNRRKSTTSPVDGVDTEEIEEIQVEDVEWFELEPSPPTPEKKEEPPRQTKPSLVATITSSSSSLTGERKSSVRSTDNAPRGGKGRTSSFADDDEEEDDGPAARGGGGKGPLSNREEQQQPRTNTIVRKHTSSRFDDEFDDEEDEQAGMTDAWKTAQDADDDWFGDHDDIHTSSLRSKGGPSSSTRQQDLSSTMSASSSSSPTGPPLKPKRSLSNHQDQTANEERIQALESELAEADARTQELEEALKREKAANNKLEKEHFIATEKMKEEQQDALKKANDEWVQERQELIRMRKEAHEESEEMEGKVMEYEEQIKELKVELQRAQEAGAGGIKYEEVQERVAKAKKEVEEEWQARLDDLQQKSRQIEEALTSQLDAQTSRVKELEEEQQKKEEHLTDLIEEVEELRHQLTQEQEARQEEGNQRIQESQIYVQQIQDLEAELEEAQVALKEEKERESDVKLEKALREVQAAVNEKESVLATFESLKTEHAAAEAALSASSHELRESQAQISRLKNEMADQERALNQYKEEIRQFASKQSVSTDRETSLELELSKVKAELESSSHHLQRKLADLQNAYNTIQKEMEANADDATKRMRELESARDMAEYEKKRAEERIAAAESWRQKENAQAQQAELALDSMRAELSSLKVGAANGLNEAQAPLLNRVKELEKEVEKERKKAEEAKSELSTQATHHQEQLHQLKEEVSSKLPGIAASAMKKVEEEWKKRMENECRAVRDAGDHETENTHLRNVALKAQLVEVQSKLQSQVAAEKMAAQSLHRLVTRLEDENRAMRRELQEMRGGGSAGGGYYSGGGGAGGNWENAVQASTLSLIQGHLQMLQAQFANAAQNNHAILSSPSQNSAMEGIYHTPTKAYVNNSNNIFSPNNKGFESSPNSYMASSPSVTAGGEISITTAAALEQNHEQQQQQPHASSSSAAGGHSSSSSDDDNDSKGGQTGGGGGGRRRRKPGSSSGTRRGEMHFEVGPQIPQSSSYEDRVFRPAGIGATSTSTHAGGRPSSAPSSRPGLHSVNIPTGLIDDGTAFGFYEGYWRSKYATNDDIGSGASARRTRMIHTFGHSPVLRRAGGTYR